MHLEPCVMHSSCAGPIEVPEGLLGVLKPGKHTDSRQNQQVYIQRLKTEPASIYAVRTSKYIYNGHYNQQACIQLAH